MIKHLFDTGLIASTGNWQNDETKQLPTLWCKLIIVAERLTQSQIRYDCKLTILLVWRTGFYSSLIKLIAFTCMFSYLVFSSEYNMIVQVIYMCKGSEIVSTIGCCTLCI